MTLCCFDWQWANGIDVEPLSFEFLHIFEPVSNSAAELQIKRAFTEPAPAPALELSGGATRKKASNSDEQIRGWFGGICTTGAARSAPRFGEIAAPFKSGEGRRRSMYQSIRVARSRKVAVIDRVATEIPGKSDG